MSKSEELDVGKLQLALQNGDLKVENLSSEQAQALIDELDPNDLGCGFELNKEEQQMCYAVSYTYHTEELYRKRLITALIGYLFRSVEEWNVPRGNHVMDLSEYDADEVERNFVEERVVDGKYERYEAQPNAARDNNRDKLRRLHAYQFLIEKFVYNSDLHVRSAFTTPAKDTPRAKNPVNPNRKKRAPARKVEEPESELERNRREYMRMTGKVPPSDIYYWFDRYYTLNFDAIQIATLKLYDVYPSLEATLRVWGQFPNTKSYKSWLDKNTHKIKGDVFCVPHNQSVAREAYSRNRDKSEYGALTNRIIQRTLEQQAADAKLAKDVNKARVDRAKRQNELEFGGAEGKAAQYIKEKMSKGERREAVKPISGNERSQLEADGNVRLQPKDSGKYLEAREIHVDSRKGRVHVERHFMEQSAPDPEKVSVVHGG